MKYFTLFIYFLLLSAAGFSQEIDQTGGQREVLSPYTKQFLESMRKFDAQTSGFSKTGINTSASQRNSGVAEIGAIAMVSPEIDEAALRALGVKVGTRAGRIWTLRIPLEALNQLGTIEGLVYVEADVPIHAKLEESRRLSMVNEVHEAVASLNQSYTGEGVIVGILDFDYVVNHPAFYDESGETNRISRLWNQSATSGNSPAVYDFGSEFVGSVDIIATGYSTSSGSHGTHVAGIAAGSGHGSSGQNRGYAPAAELVMVELGSGWEPFNFTDPFTNSTSTPSQVLDAVDYVFKYAESQNKPAVINMSLGTHIGPHDGTSLLEIGLDELTGAGKILVAAAGNEGDTPLHVAHTFNSSQTLATTIHLPESSDFTMGASVVWGDVGASFEINVAYYDKNSGQLIDETGFVSTSSNQTGNISSAADWDSGASTVFAYVETRNAYVNNNRPFAYISLGMDENEFNSYYAVVKIRSNQGTVHIWNNGNGSGNMLSTEAQGNIADSQSLTWKDGDTDFTVGEFGTANKVITVGAYNTSAGTYEDGGDFELGIASFSSRGPTLDNRVKPDIVAPGNRIVSAYNKNSEDTDPDDVTMTVTGNDGQEYVFAYSQGTSMAAPAVAGAIALMLQADPALDYQAILDNFRQTAVSADNFVALEATDTQGNPKSNTWGYGKINVLESIKKIEEGASAPDLPNLAFEGTAVITNENGATDIVEGDNLLVDFTIINKGQAATATPFKVRYTIGGTTVGEVTISDPIAPQATLAVNQTALNFNTQPGSYQLVIALDSENAIEETNTADNTQSIAFSVNSEEEQTQPLEGTITATQQTATIGESVTFQANVTGGTSPYSFSWAFSLDAELISAAADEASITVEFLEAGVVDAYATVVDADGGSLDLIAEGILSVEEEATIPPLEVDFTATSTTIQEGESVTLTAQVSGGVPPYDFSWEFSGVGTADASDNESITITYESAGVSTISLTVTDAIGTSTTQTKNDLISIEAAVVSGIDPAYVASVRVFPNPLSGNILHMESDQAAIIQEMKEIRLLGIDGRIIPIDVFKSNKEIRVLTPQLPNGLYLLQFNGQNEKGVKRILIQN